MCSGYRRPCVIDLKVGLRTYSETGHDDAYIAKRCAHDERSGQASVGFKVCGMQTWGRRTKTKRGHAPGETVSHTTPCACFGSILKDVRRRASSPVSPQFQRSTATPSVQLTDRPTVSSLRSAANRDGGWTQRRRPYEWARELRGVDDVRSALEEFVRAPDDDDAFDDDASDEYASDGALDPEYASDTVSASHAEASRANGSAGQSSVLLKASPSSRDGSPTAVDAFGDAQQQTPARRRRLAGEDVERIRSRAKEVYGEALERLAGLRRWFAAQRTLHLLGSSVLVVYEGDDDDDEGEGDGVVEAAGAAAATTCPKSSRNDAQHANGSVWEGVSLPRPTRKGVRVCVIDFCNYVDARGELDANFSAGLDRLCEMLASIRDDAE